MKPLLDEGFTSRDENYIQWIPIALVILFLARGALGFASKYASSWVANRVEADLRNAMFEHVLRLPTTFYDQHSSGRLASHIANNPSSVTGAATMALTVVVRDTLTLVALLAWLLWLDWLLTSITLALFPLMALIVRYFNQRLRKISRDSQHSFANIIHQIEEAASNNRIVKIFTAESFETKKFESANQKQRGLAMRATVASSAVTPLIQLLASLSVALIITVALHSPNHEPSSAGEFVSFLTALMMLLPPIKRLTDITSTIQRGLASAEIIFGILDEHPERATEEKEVVFSSFDVEFDDVHYRYTDDKTVISGFSLHIPQGHTFALVGKSGSGKTTLTNLLSGLYCLEKGDIRIGGQSIKSLSLRNLRKQISVVSQDVKLFNDSILNNVAYADPQPNKKRVIDALVAAHAMEFIEHLKDGIYTQIGQNGITLSGGQRQRVAIARAFYKDSPILILDEATSALDTESERAIQKALSALMTGKTSLVIAHRLSTIEHSDKIIVMKDGRIEEIGTHKDLIEKGGLYKNYHLIQFEDLTAP